MFSAKSTQVLHKLTELEIAGNLAAMTPQSDGLASQLGRSRNTPSLFILQKLDKLRPDGPLDSYADFPFSQPGLNVNLQLTSNAENPV